jgi:predicted amidohydrolase YtcJ
VTHEYTLLVGGTVIPGGYADEAEAIAWAHGVILAIGSNAEVRAISRGDSTVIDLAGACVIPLADGAAPAWPTAAVLAVGEAADLAVLDADPRPPGKNAASLLQHPMAEVRGGRVVSGVLARGAD